MQLSTLKSVIEPAEELIQGSKDLAELFNMAMAESDKEMLSHIENDLAGLLKQCGQLNCRAFSQGPMM